MTEYVCYISERDELFVGTDYLNKDDFVKEHAWLLEMAIRDGFNVWYIGIL